MARSARSISLRLLRSEGSNGERHYPSELAMASLGRLSWIWLRPTWRYAGENISHSSALKSLGEQTLSECARTGGPVDLMHAKAEFEADRLSDVAAEPSTQGDGWRLLLHAKTGAMHVLTDHAGRERLFHSLDHATEVGRDIGFLCVRVEEHF